MGKNKTPKNGASQKDSDEKTSGKGKLKPANAVHVRHILCEKHGNVMKAMEELDNGGNFDAVARKYSEDKAKQGGNLGRQTRGQMVGPFQEAAFNLEESKPDKPLYTKTPIKTVFGYHIIMIEKRE
ncbi:Peptidyl-prolyl cis-trans isomerase pin4 [Coemansia spiralis]|uniref:Peptidyl-prolyl cis-trans isomerase n=2 Tax=Coemansia TaxID=4863 RepID=A0A9W8KVX6_9FUNG|nr:Peptidyl-prolyl cis-trans isomerase pin4 [Coemansia umbellata]KAJ2619371.1 Peptidyl-prolyl cis-trans isomerase pin4 [Coemansia sp. RSA 1358]KAJ2670926.1 Peptidyl-prolyl cis-trans isomerase pin4 [Coemansia spiralis]